MKHIATLILLLATPLFAEEFPKTLSLLRVERITNSVAVATVNTNRSLQKLPPRVARKLANTNQVRERAVYGYRKDGKDVVVATWEK
jgi:hypothetical protein